MMEDALAPHHCLSRRNGVCWIEIKLDESSAIPSGMASSLRPLDTCSRLTRNRTRNCPKDRRTPPSDSHPTASSPHGPAPHGSRRYICVDSGIAASIISSDNRGKLESSGGGYAVYGTVCISSSTSSTVSFYRSLHICMLVSVSTCVLI